jgi:DnaJ domain
MRTPTIDPWKLLGVTRTATCHEIKRALRRRAFATHPDRGGDPEDFKQAYAAYEYLMALEPRTATSGGTAEENHDPHVDADTWRAHRRRTDPYVEAWHRVPRSVRGLCGVGYSIWIVAVFFFAGPGTFGGAFLFVMYHLGGVTYPPQASGVLFLVGSTLALSVYFEVWDQLRFWLMDKYSRDQMRRLR